MGDPVGAKRLDIRMGAALRSGGASFMPHCPPPDIVSLLDAMPDGHLPTLQGRGTPAAAMEGIRRGLLAAAVGPSSLTDWLCSDIGELSEAFASAIGVAYVGVQLAPTVADRTRRGGDADLGHRLVATYRGTGTVPSHFLVFLPPQWPLSTVLGQPTTGGTLVASHTTRRELILMIDDLGL